jgi:antitoxin component YwqK of YwqJK toxin-antitoxin module
MEGHYLVLDSIGVPSFRNGLWNTYNNNGQLFQQIVYEKGKVQELVCFDDEGNKID